MKKFIIKTIAFILVLAIMFLGTQSVLRYHWPDDTYSKYVDYSKLPKDTVDVFVFGTSEMMAGYSPVTTYIQQGITGYNFAVQNRAAMATYYQFMYALKYQTPKVVVCDFMSLFDNLLPSESETIYRRTVDSMPDFKVKSEMIHEICKVDSSQDMLSWFVPVFRYHTMWNELTPEDFKAYRQYNSGYESFKKGCWLNNNLINPEQPYDIVPELWDNNGEEPAQISEYSKYYYDLLIDECNKRGITVVALMTPKVSDASVIATNWPAMTEYFDSKGVKYLNYCTYDQLQRMALSMYNDYVDPAHLNTRGAITFSAFVAEDLRELVPDLPDRRQDPSCSEKWDKDWADLMVYYAQMNN